MKLKTGDKVVVITGKDKGKEGTIKAVDRKNGRVLVEGVNMVSKHTKPNAQNQQGGIIKKENFIDASNVMVVCPTCGKATRVKHAVVEGKKVRVCGCGACLDKAYAKKAAKAAAAAEEAPKKRTRKRAAKAEATATEATDKE